MITILTAASAQDTEFREAFREYLEHGFDSGSDLHRPPDAPLLTRRDIQDVAGSVGGRAIIVFRDAVTQTLPLMRPEQAIAVVDSSNEALLAYVSATGLPAIPCGLRSRDTVTLSSMDEESAVIDLRRAVTGFGEAVIEPQEIPVHLKRAPHKFALMAAAAVFLLTGGLQAPKGKK